MNSSSLIALELSTTIMDATVVDRLGPYSMRAKKRLSRKMITTTPELSVTAAIIRHKRSLMLTASHSHCQIALLLCSLVSLGDQSQRESRQAPRISKPIQVES